MKQPRVTIAELATLTPPAVDYPAPDKLVVSESALPPRIRIMHGSLRPQSYNRKLALEAERLLRFRRRDAGVWTHDLPLLDSVGTAHPRVRQLREWSEWSEGQVWVSPERHGTLTVVFKNQSDWLPLE